MNIIQYVASIVSVQKYDYKKLVSRAFSKGGFKFFSDGLVLLLLSNKFILQSVNLEDKLMKTKDKKDDKMTDK